MNTPFSSNVNNDDILLEPITIGFSDEEIEELEELATALGMTPGAYLRHSALTFSYTGQFVSGSDRYVSMSAPASEVEYSTPTISDIELLHDFFRWAALPSVRRRQATALFFDRHQQN